MLAVILAVFLSAILLILGNYSFFLFTSIESLIIISTELLPYLVILPIISVWAFMFDGFFIGAAKSNPMRNSTIFAFVIFLLINHLIMTINPNIQMLWIGYLIFLFLRGIFLSIYFKLLFVYDN